MHPYEINAQVRILFKNDQKFCPTIPAFWEHTDAFRFLISITNLNKTRHRFQSEENGSATGSTTYQSYLQAAKPQTLPSLDPGFNPPSTSLTSRRARILLIRLRAEYKSASSLQHPARTRGPRGRERIPTRAETGTERGRVERPKGSIEPRRAHSTPGADPRSANRFNPTRYPLLDAGSVRYYKCLWFVMLTVSAEADRINNPRTRTEDRATRRRITPLKAS